MKKIALYKLFFLLAFLDSSLSVAESFIYSDLQMKNYDEMQASVKKLVTEAEQVADEDMDQAKSKLKDALQLILSRPNTDNLVSQLVPAVRTPLRNIDAYESTAQEIAESAILVVKNKKSANSNIATGLIILENIMSELKPDIKSSKTSLAIFTSIRDAKIKVSDKVKTELRMRAMIKLTESPSDIARKIIGSGK